MQRKHNFPVPPTGGVEIPVSTTKEMTVPVTPIHQPIETVGLKCTSVGPIDLRTPDTDDISHGHSNFWL